MALVEEFEHALAALADRTACLLANHGLVAVGSSPRAALELAVLRALAAASDAGWEPLAAARLGAEVRLLGAVGDDLDPARLAATADQHLGLDRAGIADALSRGNGILGPVTGVVGSLMAVEGLKLASGCAPVAGTLAAFAVPAGAPVPPGASRPSPDRGRAPRRARRASTWSRWG